MAAPYLTATQASIRLSNRFEIETSSILDVYCEIASDEIDRKQGWIGSKYDENQLRAFPRDTEIADDTPGEVPPRVLDWVALRAYQLVKGDDPKISIESIDKIMVKYTSGKVSKLRRLMQHLLRDYRVRNARVI